MSASDPPAWDETTLYEVGDRVTYESETWEATVASRNATPEVGSTFWAKVNDAGSGDAPSQNPNTWSAGELYQRGDTTQYEGAVWKAALRSRAAEPSEDSPYWVKQSIGRDDSGTINVGDNRSTELAEQIVALDEQIPADHSFDDPALNRLRLRIRRLEAEVLDE